MGFLFGGDTGVKSAAELQKRREVIDAMLASNMGGGAPQTIGEGIFSAVGDLSSAWLSKRLGKQEAAAGTAASGSFDNIIAGLNSQPSASSSGSSYLAPQAPLGSATTPLDYGMESAPSERIGDQPLGFAPQGGDALNLIKGFEGFRETPYWDVNALRTGYGSDTVTLADGSVQPVGENTRVSREDADRDLSRRVETEFKPIAAQAVGPDVFASLAPPQQAALTSIAYNYGEIPASVAQAVQSGDPQAAAAAIAALGSHNGGINAGRRKKEADIFASAGTPGLSVSTQGGGPDPVPLAAFGQPLSGMPQQPSQAPAVQPQNNMAIVSQLAELTANPYLPEGQRKVAEALMAQLMTPPDPMDAINLEKGQLEVEALRNPVAKPPTPTATMQEYNLAKEQGFTGSFVEYKTAIEKSGATNVNVNTGEGDKFYENLDKGQADMMQRLMDEGLQADRTLGQVSQLESVLGDVSTGGAAQLQQLAGEWGIPTEGLDNIQAAQAIINQIVPQQRQPGSGPMSDADLALFKQSVPRLINQPGGNAIIIETMKGIAEYTRQQGDIAAQVADRTITPAQGRAALKALRNPLDGFGKRKPVAVTPNPDAPATPDAAAAAADDAAYLKSLGLE